MKMHKDQYGQLVFLEEDIENLIMTGYEPTKLDRMLVDESVDLSRAKDIVENMPNLIPYVKETISVEEFDQRAQALWHMPEKYKSLDIAKYILDLCSNDEQLQRVGEELLLFQERNLFDLLKYLKYLVDTLRDNNVVWGVGRGSSVASYVLYLLGVHRIDSMFYDLDPREFLR